MRWDKPKIPDTGAFIVFNHRSNRISLLQVFTQFINDDIVQMMINSISLASLTVKWTRGGRNLPGRIVVSKKKCWFVIAMMIRAIGYQNKPTENKRNKRKQREHLKKIKQELGPNVPGRDTYERLIEMALW